MSHGNRFLFQNGVVSPAAETPPVAAFLEAHSGAYTTTRTHNNGSQLLFWERHVQRLSNSIQLLLKSNPNLLFDKHRIHNAQFSELSNRAIMWDSVVRCLLHNSMRKVVPIVLKERKFGEELAIAMLVSGKSENVDSLEDGFDEDRVYEVLDVYMHVGGYVPGVRGNGARLAVVGRGRNFANAKYSDWVRLRKPLEKLRPPLVTELLLSNDGDQILEGCLTNFFVVCLKENDGDTNTAEQNGLGTLRSIEVQTAPLSNGVLPGVIRQVIKDICLKIGIPFREVAPSWSQRDLWTEAFITNSLRLIQHVETIQVPDTWNSVESKTLEEINWVEKHFENAPGRITLIFQKEILGRASLETFPVASFEDGGLQSNLSSL
ncbi:hypothetical protein ACJIZ3_022946 [Penstemon smallii]|uniref:Branched-chain-amino-acid aminotransferase n=1 Tax=Penstemon smallii TaxID=265156 RepID=A0ABD3TMU0_9LAMI